MADEWTLTKELHDLLYQKFLREKSREARMILGEMEEARRVASKNGYKESMGLIREDMMLLTNTFTRLGLDLEGEAE